MAAHARLSPSASMRWMKCPGSVTLTERFGLVSPTSEAASRGTAAHELAEHVLTSMPRIRGSQSKDFAILTEGQDPWLIEMVAPYIDFLTTVPGVHNYEVGAFIDQHCWGTADCASYDASTRTLYVIDLKTGQGRVDAEENTQLLLYALGTWVGCVKAGGKVSRIVLVIVQPSLDHISQWEIDLAKLGAFDLQYRESLRRILEEPDAYHVSEDTCQWCPAKAVCPAFKVHVDQLAQVEFNSEIEASALAEWLDRLPMLKGLIKTVEDQAKNRMKSFEDIPGYGLSAPYQTRSFNREKLEQIARSRGLMNVLLPRVPLTPAVARKLELSPKLKAQLDIAVEIKLGEPSIIRQK